MTSIWTFLRASILLLIITSCASLDTVNRVVGKKQLLWEKEESDGRYFLNRFRVTEKFYNSKEINDYFILTKDNYLNEYKQPDKKQQQ